MPMPPDRFNPLELGPPIVPGVTQLSPDRMRAVMGASDPRDTQAMLPAQEPPTGQENEHGPEGALPQLIEEQGRLLARAAQLGPDALDMLASMVRSVSFQVKKQATATRIGVAPAETGQVPVPMQSPLLQPPSPNEWEPPRQAPPILSQLMQMARG